MPVRINVPLLSCTPNIMSSAQITGLILRWTIKRNMNVMPRSQPLSICVAQKKPHLFLFFYPNYMYILIKFWFTSKHNHDIFPKNIFFPLDFFIYIYKSGRKLYVEIQILNEPLVYKFFFIIEQATFFKATIKRHYMYIQIPCHVIIKIWEL